MWCLRWTWTRLEDLNLINEENNDDQIVKDTKKKNAEIEKAAFLSYIERKEKL